MLVGTSFSKCLLDLYEGTVNYDDVLVIVTGTDFDPYNDTHWANIWEGYTGRRGLSLGHSTTTRNKSSVRSLLSCTTVAYYTSPGSTVALLRAHRITG